MEIIALVLFIVTYILLLVFQKARAYIALGTAIIFVIIGVMDYRNLLVTINWNVLMMIGGTMGTVFLFIESKMPARMADVIIDKTPNVMWTVFALSLFSGIVSAFVDNVATVLMVAPVALTICKKLDVSPVPVLICISVSSNLQGAATLVGDTTSIMMAGEANMNFLDFFVFQGRMGMFFVTEIAAIASLLIVLLLFRKDRQPIQCLEKTEVKDYFPTYAMLGTIILLIVASFLPDSMHIIVNRADSARAMDLTNGVICVGVFAIALVVEMIKQKEFDVLKRAFAEIDFFTLLLLASLFVVVGGIKEVGLIQRISDLFLAIGGGNVFWIYTIIVWASVIFSAFIDNIPYVATMLPVTTAIAMSMGIEPYLLYFGLLCGATLGGNLTPIGASANITTIGILRKEGYVVKNKDFLKIGVPFTLTAVVVGYLLIWLAWKPF